ncbi:MAG: TerC family protein [Phycisphaerales bacterium]|nr:TerC family protein [Phycisphaerales bacterium]
MSELFTTENGIAFLTLTALEIVLGIDNIVFIAILAGKLEPRQQDNARRAGLLLAMVLRLCLLGAISWIVGLKEPFFHVFGHGFSGKDLIMLGGGLFLIAKATYEIHHKLEGPEPGASHKKATASFMGVILQILMIDAVFSLDSVITAVGMADNYIVMAAAIIISVGIMLFASGPISAFVQRHPTMKMLALSFLILIGVMLVVDGIGEEIPKGYIYFAMAFSLVVELLNIRVRKVTHTVAGPKG